MKLPESQHVFFREFRESDWNAVHHYASHSDTVQYMDWGPNTEEETQAFIQHTLKSQVLNPRTNFDFAVIDPATDLLIGTAGIRIQDAQSLVADFGYILRAEYWGRGLGTEIAQAMVHFGFQELGMHRIWATCRPQNIASSRVLEKAGLKCEGYLRGHKRIRGSWTDSYLYAITKDNLILDQSFMRNSRKDSALKCSQGAISIREAKPEDAHLLAEAERQIAIQPGFLISRPQEILAENFQKKIKYLSKTQNGKYIIAEIEGKLVGHALLDPLPFEAIQHVVHLTIAVHNGWQNQGIGQAMLSFLIHWAKQSSVVEKIELHVRSSNSRAIALYQKLGFQEEGRLRRRVKIKNSEYLDDVLMGLWVGGSRSA